MVDQSLAELLMQHGLDDQTAQQLQNTVSGSDLINLINSLNLPDSQSAVAQANQILHRYGVSIKEAAMNNDHLYRMYKGTDSTQTVAEQPIENLKSMLQSNNPEDHLLVREGFNYYTIMEEPLSEELIEWLDNHKIEFLTNGRGHFHIKCEDRDHAYKVGRAISGLMRRQRLVRDSASAGDEMMSEKNNAKRREREAKEKLSNFKQRNPIALQALQLQAKTGGPMDDATRRKKQQTDSFGRGAKHKSSGKWDEQIDSIVAESERPVELGVVRNGKLRMVAEADIDMQLNEGVMGLANVNPLFRLRELAGLPPTMPEPAVEPTSLAPPENDFDSSQEVMPSEPMSDLDGLGDLEPSPDMAAGSGMDPTMDPAMSVDVAGVPGPQAIPSPAMTEIDNHLNNVQLQLPDIKMSEYKILIHKLQDLTNQLQAMGRDYLGERRAMKR